jgi:hypothetical protein
MYGNIIRVIRGENGKGKGDFSYFEINKGITFVLLINVSKIGNHITTKFCFLFYPKHL